jgi:hypothetical protein
VMNSVKDTKGGMIQKRPLQHWCGLNQAFD